MIFYRNYENYRSECDHLLRDLSRGGNGTVINRRQSLVAKTRLATCFALRGERFASSSRLIKRSSFVLHGLDTHYRNDPIKYDLIENRAANEVIELNVWIHVVTWYPLRRRIFHVFNFSMNCSANNGNWRIVHCTARRDAHYRNDPIKYDLRGC